MYQEKNVTVVVKFYQKEMLPRNFPKFGSFQVNLTPKFSNRHKHFLAAPVLIPFPSIYNRRYGAQRISSSV
jgi:hypothetical protein